MTAAIAAAACLATGPAEAQHGAPADGEWRSYAGDSGSTKYSPLDQIVGSTINDRTITQEGPPGSPVPSKRGPAVTSGTSAPRPRAATSSARTPGSTSRGATAAIPTSGR